VEGECCVGNWESLLRITALIDRLKNPSRIGLRGTRGQREKCERQRWK
jgi:hypothetical protein